MTDQPTLDIARARGAKQWLLVFFVLVVAALFVLSVLHMPSELTALLAELALLMFAAYQVYLWKLGSALGLSRSRQVMNTVLTFIPLWNLVVFAQTLRAYSQRTRIPLSFLMRDRPKDGSLPPAPPPMNGWRRLWVFTSLVLLLGAWIYVADYGDSYASDNQNLLFNTFNMWLAVSVGLYLAGVGVRWVIRGFQLQVSSGDKRDQP